MRVFLSRNNRSTLKLSEDEVKRCLNIEEAIKAVESAFSEFGRGDAQIPTKKYLFFQKHDGDYRSMPGYLENEDIAGCKLVNVHPDNEDLPTVMALLVLVNPKNGFPFCIMDGSYLTSYRTGAAGAVATKYLARKDSEKIGFVGAGVQSHTQFLALNEVQDLKEAYIYDVSQENADELKKFIEKKGVKASICNDVESVAKKIDILVTTTPVRDPLVKKEWITEGTHINAIGADAEGKQELESDLVRTSKIVVDQIEPASHSGEINVPYSKGLISNKDIYSEISDIVNGVKEGRSNKKEITIFDSTGLAIQDIATGHRVYKNAIGKGIGEEIKFF